MEALVGAAGFAEVRTVTRSLPVSFADADQWYAFSQSTGQRAMWSLVPDAEKPAVLADAVRLLAAAARAGGGFLLHQQVRYTIGSTLG